MNKSAEPKSMRAVLTPLIPIFVTVAFAIAALAILLAKASGHANGGTQAAPPRPPQQYVPPQPTYSPPPKIHIHYGDTAHSRTPAPPASSAPHVERSITIVCTNLTTLLHKSADGKLSEAILSRYVNRWHNLDFKTNDHYISAEVGFLWNDIYSTPPSATGLQFAKDLRLMGRDCNRAGFHVPYVS